MPIASLYVQRSDEPEAATLFGRLRNQGHTALKRLSIERLYRLEYDPGFASLEQIMRGGLNFDALKTLLVNPVFETSSTESALKLKDGPIVEVGYRAAVTDPETPSIIAGARALGQNGLVWARLLLRYQFEGLSEAEALSIAQTSLSNPVVQEVFVPKSGQPERRVHSLRPTGVPDPVRGVSFAELDDAELARLSESSSWYAPLSQMKALQTYERKIGRPFTDAEVEIVVQSWSDHCYHTTWKSLGLLDLLINATASVNRPDIVSVFKDNAGGLLLNDEWVVTIKGETHNFPSSIAPFGGVATKHGGVIRDTVGFGKGGFPIGGSTIMGTLDPRTPDDRVPGGALPPGYLLRESIRATAYYCNPMGIPMMYPAYRIHPGYPKCLALGHSVGLIPRRHALKDDPRPGDVVLLLGGRTGRDGLHGATASSAHMTAETLAKEAAAVQIGHPIDRKSVV